MSPQEIDLEARQFKAANMWMKTITEKEKLLSSDRCKRYVENYYR